MTWHILFSPPCSHLPSWYPLHPNGLTLWSMLSFAIPSALASSPSRRVEGVINYGKSLHMNLPVGNFQRCERVFTCFFGCNLPSISYCWWSFSSTSSTSSPRFSQLLFLPAHLVPAPLCQLLSCTTVLFKVLNIRWKKFFFMFCVCFWCITCVKAL